MATLNGTSELLINGGQPAGRICDGHGALHSFPAKSPELVPLPGRPVRRSTRQEGTPDAGELDHLALVPVARWQPEKHEAVAEGTCIDVTRISGQTQRPSRCRDGGADEELSPDYYLPIADLRVEQVRVPLQSSASPQFLEDGLPAQADPPHGPHL